MSREQIVQIARILLAAALAIAAVFGYDLGVLQPRQEAMQAQTLQIAAELIERSAPMLSGAGSDASTSGVSHFENLSADGEVDVGTFVNLSEASALTVTDGAAFTPMGSYCPITAGSEVTPTVSTTGFTAGDLLVLVNEGTNTINLADSGTMMLSAAWAAAQYDLLALWFDGTNWIELSRADN